MERKLFLKTQVKVLAATKSDVSSSISRGHHDGRRKKRTLMRFLVFESQRQTLVNNYKGISGLDGSYQKRTLKPPPNLKVSQTLESVEK